ncbi:hypothetical protein [Rhodanobacter sp. C05]|jgi:hypothetical protein|uniref:hypothetical protein n=1 Tax=Rhodanobacter sp. C05 TaxID=1945855 RepID=UPI000986B731|nr:hypothetical protein [Rhodanobacter sp. C05]OOG42675.1 hypothetical protein B0E51_04290 [Rhodanobacter sp. C05]
MMGKGKWSGDHMRERQKRAVMIRTGRKKEGTWAALIAELIFARECINPGMLEDEPSLADTTWLPYRYMSAFERTELFSTEYESAFKRLHAQYKDFHKAAGMQPVHPEYACNTRAEMTSLWKARQCADAMGVSYSIFISVAMDVAINRHYEKVPRPNQLCRPWQIEAVRVAWLKEIEIAQLFADDWDPRFFAPSLRDDPARKAALDAMSEHVKRAAPGRWAERLANYMFRRLAINEVEARQRFDDEVVDDAISLPYAPTMTLHVASEKPYRPHCLGMQQLPPAPQCAGCSLSDACVKLSKLVDIEFIKSSGTADPQKARDREQAAERQRRHREKIRKMQMQSEV